MDTVAMKAGMPDKVEFQRLSAIKKNVKGSFDYFRDNYKRFSQFKYFLYKSNWSDTERQAIVQMGKPDMEFNVLQSFVDRLIGEFSKQEPSAEISSDSYTPKQVQVIKFLEQHLSHVINDDSASSMKIDLWKDLLVGGFSVAEIYTDYTSPMSMMQNIYIRRVFDPLLCSFDPLARESHKGDGRWCCKVFPLSEEDFKEMYPHVDTKTISFTKQIDGFSWSYRNGNKKVVLVADYYEKKKKRFQIVETTDGKVMRKSEYNKMLKSFEEMVMRGETIGVPPSIVGKPRTTETETIVRYRLMESQILSYEETDYSMLPLVFIDGNSEFLKQSDDGDTYQFTKPYIYHAKDPQKFKNYCGSSWANAVENEIQHKFMVAKEALPKEHEFRRWYTDFQHPGTIVYNSVHENNPEMPILNPIQPIPKIPAPPEVLQGFTVVDGLMQQVLGSYDSALGINNNQLSGVAVIEAATQSNSAAMPYMLGFLRGLERITQIYVDLIPKYYTTPRTIPIRNSKGKREYIPINQDKSQTFDYEDGVFNVKIKAGASFQVQKQRTIMMVQQLMQTSQVFAQFINEKGLDFLLDNMEGRSIEQLKLEVDQWQKELQQQKQMAMQQQQAEMQNNPAVMRNQIDMQKLQLESQKMDKQHMVDMLKLEVEHNKIDADLHMSHEKDKMELHKVELDHHHKMEAQKNAKSSKQLQR